MLECLACGYENDENARVCEACETPLYSIAIIDPLATETLMFDKVEVAQQSQAVQGGEVFKRGMVLNFHIQGDDRIIRIRPSDAILLGRKDPRLRITPDVDLTDYDGSRKGISRTHAALRIMDESIFLFDMRSANGTYHNGERAEPGQPRLLRDGDRLQLGEMVLTIRFSD
jgi:hypothetical protein